MLIKCLYCGEVIETMEELEKIRVEYIGKKGFVTDLLKEMKSLSNEEKKLYESLFEIETGRVKKQSVKEKIKGAFK